MAADPVSNGTDILPAQAQDTSANSSTSTLLNPTNFPQTLITSHTHTELCYTPLDIPAALAFTRSPLAGANVLFLGTTRNNFDDRPVTRLSYSAYPALALKSLSAIGEDVRKKHGLEKVYIAHRLGEVGIQEESIAVSVSSGHRQAGWRGAEEILERVKQRAEIWKREWFGDTGGVEEGVWRANKDRDGTGKPVERNLVQQEAQAPSEQADGTTQATGGEATTSKQATSAYGSSKALDNEISKYMSSLAEQLKM
ncbi:Molybdopterin synthase catalytic subunit [Cyphellophora attinorum]|uniref:Molybdopterin synthase catalytic subunit n=1 Tax=Cyphellophora attinorum TaxID=1664694 RepID=A0A0N0NQH1_9EURO|nr:Molybdopterin synthase catalytic subunit [Phialophora attinorum]KPI43901.1 Molybdopterin synthase catalytic subunit [Phialophora attinorum]